MIFIEIHELKTRLGATSIDVVRSPKTGKLFASANGKAFKVEQTIDSKKPIKFMYNTEAEFSEGCIVNVTPSAPPVMVL